MNGELYGSCPHIANVATLLLLCSRAQRAAVLAKKSRMQIHDMQTKTVSLQLRAERAMYSSSACLGGRSPCVVHFLSARNHPRGVWIDRYAARALSKDARRYGIQARR